MVAVVVADADEMVGVDPPVVVRERLEAFAGELLAQATNRPVRMVNGGLYLRGLIEQGPRKSLEPLVERLGEEADYHSMQQFLVDSPWDPALVVKAVAERVAPAVDVQAWVIDDTGFPKDGKDSPGVKRQYSGTLGKTGNCQIGVSLHAVDGKGTVPLGWALYLPEGWCVDPERRGKAKIPQEVRFKTKPELGVELVERAAGWKVKKAPVLGDCAYGNNTELRDKLHAARNYNTCCRSRPRRLCSRPRPCSKCPPTRAKEEGVTSVRGRTATRSRSARSLPALREVPERPSASVMGQTASR
jgi:SRSO17 transposase